MSKIKELASLCAVILMGVVLLFGLLLVAYWRARVDPPPPRKDYTDAVLTALANRTNQRLPAMVNAATRLEKALVGPEKSFILVYTLVNLVKDENSDPSEALDAIRPDLETYLQSSKSLKPLWDQGVAFHCVYLDKHGGYVGEIVVRPNELKSRSTASSPSPAP